MSFCVNCGNQLQDNVKFCPSCGTAVQSGSDSASKSEAPKISPETNSQIVEHSNESNCLKEKNCANRKQNKGLWTLLGVVSLALAIYAWCVKGTVATIIISIIAIGLAIFSLIKKAKLKAFPILGIIVAALLLVAWIIQWTVFDKKDSANEGTTSVSITETSSVKKDTSSDSLLASVVNSDFKKTMDSYEQFFNDYASFLEKYSKADGSEDAFAMLADYTTFMTKYAETMEALDSIDVEKLSTADYAYYVEVMARINKRLAEVSQ